MYAVMARTVLGPRGPAEAKELIELFDDRDEDIAVRCAAAPCLVLFGEQARAAVPSLRKAIMEDDDVRHGSALAALWQLGQWVSGPVPPVRSDRSQIVPDPPGPNPTRPEMTRFLVNEADGRRWLQSFNPMY
jgi:hypothetical protein